jgi:hypothetical protein
MQETIIRWFWILGRVFGGLVGLITFIGCWLAAIEQWGWLLGIAFGWIPAIIIAALAGALAWLLWAPLWAAALLALLAFLAFLWWGAFVGRFSLR